MVMEINVEFDDRKPLPPSQFLKFNFDDSVKILASIRSL